MGTARSWPTPKSNALLMAKYQQSKSSSCSCKLSLMYFDFVFVTLSSICDKATAYNCIGRVYCLHSVFGEFSVQAPPRDPPLEAKLAVLASSTRSYPKGNSKRSWACHDK